MASKYGGIEISESKFGGEPLKESNSTNISPVTPVSKAKVAGGFIESALTIGTGSIAEVSAGIACRGF